MGFDSVLTQYIITAIIGAIVGAIFGASGLLFFPLKRYMEKRFEGAEKKATDRDMYQKEMMKINAEEKSATNKYLFWLKESVTIMLSTCQCSKENGDYFRHHLEEASNELLEKEAKRKDIERNKLIDYDINNQ